MEKIKAKILYLQNYDKSWGVMQYAHDTDTGFDIRACNFDDIIIKKGERKLIPAGFKILPETNYALQIRARSGNSLKLGLSLPNGVGTIDNGYLGEINVIAVNIGTDDIIIQRGMKIAQGVVEKVYQFDFIEVESEDDFEKTSRGENGFGSTGI